MDICVFGDSITWGACDYEKGGWVERLKTYLMRKGSDADVYNLGISGNTTEDLLERFEKEATDREADMIVFAIGINDSASMENRNCPRVALEQFRGNISELAERAKKITDKVVFVGLTKVDESKTMPVPWVVDLYYENRHIRQYDAALEEVCEKENCSFVSIFDLLGDDDLADGLHPNSQGHEKIFEKARKAVEEIIG